VSAIYAVFNQTKDLVKLTKKSATHETPHLSQHSVFIVEDDSLTRSRISSRVSNHDKLMVVGEAESIESATAQWQSLTTADVVLIDLGLPDGDGTQIIQKLSASAQPPYCLVISVFGDERRVVKAIEAGASGYLLKDSDEESLAELILQTLRGDCPINPSIARHLLKKFRVNDKQPTLPSPITKRETEVLTLVARGYSNTEISELLQMSFHTVTSHTKSIYRKLAVNSRSEAVFEAAQLGLITLHPKKSQ